MDINPISPCSTTTLRSPLQQVQSHHDHWLITLELLSYTLILTVFTLSKLSWCPIAPAGPSTILLGSSVTTQRVSQPKKPASELAQVSQTANIERQQCRQKGKAGTDTVDAIKTNRLFVHL